MELTELRDYIITLDKVDQQMIDNKVAENGIENYLFSLGLDKGPEDFEYF